MRYLAGNALSQFKHNLANLANHVEVDWSVSLIPFLPDMFISWGWGVVLTDFSLQS